MTENQPNPESFIPLSPSVFQILLALADQERHGYDIMLEVETRTGGRVRLAPGTLYGAVKRLLKHGLIIESDERPDPALDDERRRYYRMTLLGRRVLEVEVARMSELVSQAESKDLRPGWTASTK